MKLDHNNINEYITNQLVFNLFKSTTSPVGFICISNNFNSNFTSTTLNYKVVLVNSKVTIDEVKVFDMTGHLVLNVAPENQAISFAADFNQAVGVYIVKVKLTNGQIITSKLINTKN